MAFLELCEKYFGSRNFYEVLNIETTASQKEVRKAYLTLSMSCHPDRVEECDKLISTEKFKILGKIHSVLSDCEKRAIYDEIGTWGDDDDVGFDDCDWMEYWRNMFKQITIDDIMKFEDRYKGSDEELNDLRKAYENTKGDMDQIYAYVPFVTLEEEDRIRARLQELIEKNELPAYDLFTNEPQAKRDRRIRKLRKEAKEAETVAKNIEERESNSFGDLRQLILSRRQPSSDNFLSALERKYASPKSKGNTKKKSLGSKK